MTTAAANLEYTKQFSTHVFKNCVKRAWQLFKQAPIKLTLFLIGFLFIELAFQLIPGPVGMLLSKLVVGVLAIGTWVLLDNLSRENRFSIKVLLSVFKNHRAYVLALFLMLPFVIQTYTAYLLLGMDGINLILYQTPTEISVTSFALILVSAAPVMILLLFAPALVVLANNTVINAIKTSVRFVLANWKMSLSLLLINGLVIFLAPYTFILSVVLISPWLACLHYKIFQHYLVFKDSV